MGQSVLDLGEVCKASAAFRDNRIRRGGVGKAGGISVRRDGKRSKKKIAIRPLHRED